jgi:hypothetical protein
MRRRQQKFVPREREFNRLIRFLSNSEGGLLLLGGDRGSGKTTLVQMAIASYTKKERAGYNRIRRVLSKLRELTMSRVVNIYIPLIIIDTPAATSQDTAEQDLRGKYRSLLMRAMIIGMEADLLRRYTPYYARIDLPQRWFRSIGYLQRIKSLVPYSHYIKLSKNTSRSLSLSHGDLGSNLEHALSAEVDLSDSSLEIKLRDLLSQYAKIHKFVFVFDELDKLSPQIAPENIVLYLKNLFSETGVYGIFITDEATLRRITNEAAGIPPTELTTLFADHLLLNNMSPDEFAAAITASVENIDENRNQFMSALTLRTHRSPHELSKLFIRYGYGYQELMSGLRSELGKDKFSRLGVMQLYIDYVREKFSGVYDTYFDRELNQVLEEAGSILLAQSTLYLEFLHPLSIFYTTQLFSAAGLSQTQMQEAELSYKTNRDRTVNPATPEIVTMVRNLEISERSRSLQNAIELLITLLNRSDMLSLYHTRSSDLKVLKIGPINKTNFTYERVNLLRFDSILDLGPKEKETISTVYRYNNAYNQLTGKDIFDPYFPIAPDPKVIDEVDAEVWGNKFSFSNILPVWKRMDTVAQNAQKNLLHQLLEAVKKHIKDTTAQRFSAIDFDHKTLTIRLASGKSAQIIMLFGGQRLSVDDSIDKTFVLRDPSARNHTTAVRRNIRNIKLSQNWANANSALKSIATWLDKNS